jgi:four helix bundle protein
MGKYQSFEELPVWQEAKRLYNAVLDLVELPKSPLTPAFRDQLDRAAFAVSNNIAEGFQHSVGGEADSFIEVARESSGTVRSMVGLVQDRPKLKRIAKQLKGICDLAESCVQQLRDWPTSMNGAANEDVKQLPERERHALEFVQKAKDFRLSFLRELKPEHPLYNSAEARAARGEV